MIKDVTTVNTTVTASYTWVSEKGSGLRLKDVNTWFNNATINTIVLAKVALSIFIFHHLNKLISAKIKVTATDMTLTDNEIFARLFCFCSVISFSIFSNRKLASFLVIKVEVSKSNFVSILSTLFASADSWGSNTEILSFSFWSNVHYPQ